MPYYFPLVDLVTYIYTCPGRSNLLGLTCDIFLIFKRKDAEISSLSSKLESEQNLVAQLQKKIKELQVRRRAIQMSHSDIKSTCMKLLVTVSLKPCTLDVIG